MCLVRNAHLTCCTLLALGGMDVSSRRPRAYQAPAALCLPCSTHAGMVAGRAGVCRAGAHLDPNAVSVASGLHSPASCEGAVGRSQPVSAVVVSNARGRRVCCRPVQTGRLRHEPMRGSTSMRWQAATVHTCCSRTSDAARRQRGTVDGWGVARGVCVAVGSCSRHRWVGPGWCRADGHVDSTVTSGLRWQDSRTAVAVVAVRRGGVASP